MISSTSGHVGHHGGRRRQGQGGVLEVVDEIIYYHFLHNFGRDFAGKSIENDFMYSGWTIIYYHIIHHFGLVFDGKLIANDFK